ncbi:MAG: hypothetical protein KBC21_02695 [Candidatus Pacebacteria bacterium]|nr:hypothetical protein [Candidatus Paceibacterota bacterium]
MGFITFIKGLFTLSSEQLEAVEERRKNLILRIMANYHRGDDFGSMSFRKIYLEFNRHEALKSEDFLRLLQEVITAGFVQRLDGGNKELSPRQVTYVISSNGLNHIGLPG